MQIRKIYKPHPQVLQNIIGSLFSPEAAQAYAFRVTNINRLHTLDTKYMKI